MAEERYERIHCCTKPLGAALEADFPATAIEGLALETGLEEGFRERANLLPKLTLEVMDNMSG
jgi:hypothetical protein